MAWTAPSTFVAGAILTAAQLNTNVRDNTLAGGPIYTTEAARDAAITSPFEGQRAYITGSTETTAAGAVTSIPVGIQTIYNGAGWVTVTPVGSYNGSGVTTTSASMTNPTGGTGANPSVTLRTGTTALVSFGALIYANTAGNAYMGVGVTGASSLSAGAGPFSVYNPLTTGAISGRTFVVTPLTAGLNVFTLQYQAGAFTGNYQDRTLAVQGIA